MGSLGRRGRIVGLIAALGLAVAACGGDEEGGGATSGGSGDGGGTTTKITVATLPITSNAVIKLAQDKGWFREERLEVETITVPNPAAVVAAVQGGQAQFGYSPSIPVLAAAAQGVDLRVVAPADGTNPEAHSAIEGGASPGEYDDTAVLARPDAGIASPKDLAGKTVAVPARKAQMEVSIAKAVADDGGDPSTIKWIALGFPEMGAALQAKRVDAIGTVTPFTGQAEAKGAEAVAYPALALFPEGAVGLWISTSEYVDGNPEVVQGFQTAIKRVNAYANDNLDEVLQVATTTTQTPIDVLKGAAEPYWPTAVTAEDLRRAADAMVELGYLPSAPDVQTILAT
jgi:NitT/TauT family transport system substrate-binding protein